MTISAGLFALILAVVFILGMVTTPLLFYAVVTAPTKKRALAHGRQER